MNRSPDHVGKTGLLPSLPNLIGESEIIIIENAEQLWSSPGGNCFQVCAGSDDIESIATKLKQQIAGVLSLAAFCGGNELRRTASHGDINVSSIDKIGCDFLRIVRLGCVRVESCAGQVRELGVRHQACGSSVLACQFNDALERFAVAVYSESAIRHPFAGGDCGGCSRLIGGREILRVIHHQRRIRHQIHVQPCAGSGGIRASRREPGR